MRNIIVTGSAGLIGSETVKHFAKEGYRVVGIDNDMRSRFFGAEASTQKDARSARARRFADYEHHDLDIRDADGVMRVFQEASRATSRPSCTPPRSLRMIGRRAIRRRISRSMPTAPSILLEAAREVCPEAPFVFTSTNKVYGDTPNRLPLRELPLRWEIEPRATNTSRAFPKR